MRGVSNKILDKYTKTERQHRRTTSALQRYKEQRLQAAEDLADISSN